MSFATSRFILKSGLKRGALFALVIAGGCTSATSHGGAPFFHRNGRRELTKTDQVSQLLSRLTFGARPGDAEAVRAIGVDRWIERQLHPAKIVDSVVDRVLAPLATWSKPTSTLLQTAPVTPPANTAITTDSTGKKKVVVNGLVTGTPLGQISTDQFLAGKIIRAQLSERQLQEVMADFWENHFSVFVGKMPSRDAIIAWDRDALRPNALGRFRDLLGAVAHSPAMLFYLDNQNSRKRGINENYARELLELHTLGVDGGYTQQDVIAVARALTGWTLSPVTPGAAALNSSRTFTFNAAMHDSAVKTVLGHALVAGRGVEDGEAVLDIIAHHPSTAHFIAFKLARKFVSDTPPPALVARAAATFTRTDGNIAEVVRTIVTSAEFFSRAALRSKVKTPFELVVSARRALNAPADTTARTVRLVAQMGQPIFGHLTPEGWPDDASAWMNTGTILQRIRSGSDMVAGAQGQKTLQGWLGWTPLSTLAIDAQADGVVRLVLGGIAAPTTRSALLSTHGEPASRLREMMTLALGSPEFQHR